jgi:hypothetical protein
MTGQQRTKIGQIEGVCCLIPVSKGVFVENVSEAWPVIPGRMENPFSSFEDYGEVGLGHFAN